MKFVPIDSCEEPKYEIKDHWLQVTIFAFDSYRIGFPVVADLVNHWKRVNLLTL